MTFGSMSKETLPLENRPRLTEEQIRTHTIGELKPLSGRILIVDYDSQWPELFGREADRIRAVLGRRALRIEHTGSTSVPGLVAKPIIDVLLVVADSGMKRRTCWPWRRSATCLVSERPTGTSTGCSRGRTRKSTCTFPLIPQRAKLPLQKGHLRRHKPGTFAAGDAISGASSSHRSA